MPKLYAPLKAPRRLLFGPGPSMVSPRVYAAMGQNVVGHLDPFFFEVADEVRSLLGYVYSTANHFNMAISGTGSSGMETAVANFAEPGRKFALLSNGFFADRIGEMARRQGAEVVRLAKEWGQPFDPQEAREFIRREQPHMVAFVQAETSTGMYNQAQSRSARRRTKWARWRSPIASPRWAACPCWWTRTASTSPIAARRRAWAARRDSRPMTVSPRALERLKARTTPVQSWYLDLQLLDTYYTGHKYHHTASATLFYALREGWRWWPRKAWRTVGSATAAITRRSWPASRPWAWRCWWPKSTGYGP